MSDIQQITHKTTGQKIFSTLLFLYPASYRKRFADEMLQVCNQMYAEQQVKQRIIFLFWVEIFLDTLKEAGIQHVLLIEKQGIKKYFQNNFGINRFNIIGIFFLLPAFFMFAIDFFSRVAQHDLTHYNRSTYLFLSHTPLYWYPILFTWVFIFPILAVVINLFPLLSGFRRKIKLFSVAFITHNVFSLSIVIVALFFLAIVKLHDIAPCTIRGLFRFGFWQLSRTVLVCSNA